MKAAKLTELIKICRNLSRNAVSGSLQDSFGSLPRLAYLSIDSNQLSGPLPESLRTLASLKAVHIGNNSLSGSLLFPNAWQLVDLYAGHNQFTYLNISANTRLQRVVLSDNALSVAVPDIRSFVNLTLFAAARNSLQGSVPPLAGGKKLKILYVPPAFRSTILLTHCTAWQGSFS